MAVEGAFSLHERLAADCSVLEDWPLCRVLLMNDARYTWLILVPRRENITEVHQLSAKDRQQAMEEMNRAALALTSIAPVDKINIGALGNMVPQLHLHVIARMTTDEAWPAPVWGVGTPVPYEEDAKQDLGETLKRAFADGPVQ